MKTVSYKILKSDSLEELEEATLEYLQKGWILQGDLIIYVVDNKVVSNYNKGGLERFKPINHFLQPMIKYNKGSL